MPLSHATSMNLITLNRHFVFSRCAPDDRSTRATATKNLTRRQIWQPMAMEGGLPLTAHNNSCLLPSFKDFSSLGESAEALTCLCCLWGLRDVILACTLVYSKVDLSTAIISADNTTRYVQDLVTCTSLQNRSAWVGTQNLRSSSCFGVIATGKIPTRLIPICTPSHLQKCPLEVLHYSLFCCRVLV